MRMEAMLAKAQQLTSQRLAAQSRAKVVVWGFNTGRPS
jgi:hypothetical protein